MLSPSTAANAEAHAQEEEEEEEVVDDEEDEEEEDEDEEQADNVEDDDTRLRTWKRLLSEVPVASVLPRDKSFGVSITEGRDNDAAERLAFYGDKILSLSVARALYAQQMVSGGDAATRSLGELSSLFSACTSNLLFARLLPRLLTPAMVAAVPADALVAGRQHSLGTMVEAAVCLVHEGGDEGPEAVAEVGAFLVAEAEAHAGAISNHKGTLLVLLARGVPGALSRGKRTGDSFVSTARLDGVTAEERGRHKREAEQKAAKAALERVLERDRGAKDGEGWTGTAKSPQPPRRCFAPPSCDAQVLRAAAEPEDVSSVESNSKSPAITVTVPVCRGSSSDSCMNYKGTLYEFVAKGVKGSMTVKSHGVHFVSTARLDGATAKKRGRTKKEAEQKAAKAVFEKLLERDGGGGGRKASGKRSRASSSSPSSSSKKNVSAHTAGEGGGGGDDEGKYSYNGDDDGWTGTSDAPVAPPTAFNIGKT